MNWYRKAQSQDVNSWLSKEMARITDNYKLQIHFPPEYVEIVKEWIAETNPDLSNIGLLTAYEKAKKYNEQKDREKLDPYSPEQINRNWNKFIAQTQNLNPDGPDFAVDLRIKPKGSNRAFINKANKEIHALGNYHEVIPLQDIFDILRKYDIVALQEDGAKWSGLLVGGAECGSEKANDQYALFTLASPVGDLGYVPINKTLRLQWCKMPSGKYEIVSYVS